MFVGLPKFEANRSRGFLSYDRTNKQRNKHPPKQRLKLYVFIQMQNAFFKEVPNQFNQKIYPLPFLPEIQSEVCMSLLNHKITSLYTFLPYISTKWLNLNFSRLFTTQAQGYILQLCLAQLIDKTRSKPFRIHLIQPVYKNIFTLN